MHAEKQFVRAILKYISSSHPDMEKPVDLEQRHEQTIQPDIEAGCAQMRANRC